MVEVVDGTDDAVVLCVNVCVVDDGDELVETTSAAVVAVTLGFTDDVVAVTFGSTVVVCVVTVAVVVVCVEVNNTVLCGIVVAVTLGLVEGAAVEDDVGCGVVGVFVALVDVDGAR